MPLDKRWRGLRVTRARRQGDRIHIRVRDPSQPHKTNRWLLLTQTEHRRGLTCEYCPS